MKTPKLNKNNNNFKSINREDYESNRTHGWHVRVYFKGKRYTKWFSDKKWGGKEAALKEAIAWRNKTEARIGKPRSDRPVVATSNTQTGVVGVTLNYAQSHYIVSWASPNGKLKRATVSIDKYGKKAAFARACKIREEKNAERLATPFQENNENLIINLSDEILSKIDLIRFEKGRYDDRMPTRKEIVYVLIEKALECRDKENGKREIIVKGGVKIL